MEISEEGTTIMGTKKPKLVLEDYLHFIDDRTLDLTVPQLIQIIGMHGFKRNKAQKRILMDMVSTMDLMNLPRSTLLDAGVSGDARLTLDEVINDLKDLDWQECHVTSLFTHGAAVASSASSNVTVSAKRKKSKASGRKKAVEVAVDRSLISTSGTTVAAGSTTERKRGKQKKSQEPRL